MQVARKQHGISKHFKFVDTCQTTSSNIAMHHYLRLLCVVISMTRNPPRGGYHIGLRFFLWEKPQQVVQSTPTPEGKEPWPEGGLCSASLRERRGTRCSVSALRCRAAGRTAGPGLCRLWRQPRITGRARTLALAGRRPPSAASDPALY